MRAFIFSLDAFVAFTLALMAIYSLIFFSSVPSAYYFLLTQGHYLSRDTLLSLSLTACTADYGPCRSTGGSILDNIVAENTQDWVANRQSLVQSTIGVMVPSQFGYALEVSGDGGNSWDLVYDTSASNDPQHMTGKNRRLSVASEIITFGYSGAVSKLKTSPYDYYSCRGNGEMEGGTLAGQAIGTGSTQTIDLGIITCGVIPITNSDGTITDKVRGNMYPSNYSGGAAGEPLVPASDVSLVKLTVYI